MTDLFRTLTPEECDRLIQHARIRRAEREARISWVQHHRQFQQKVWPAHSVQPAQCPQGNEGLGTQVVGR